MAGIVGRAGELLAVAQLLEGLDGGAAGLLFCGAPGIGKTTIWAEAVDRARSSSLVLTARPAQAEAKMAFAALADLLEPVDEVVLDELPEPQRAAIAIALLREEPGAHDVGARAVGASTLSVLRVLAERSAVLIALDDVQWLDRPSARALDFAVRRLGGVRVGILACERRGDGVKAAIDLQSALSDGRFHRVELETLSDPQLHLVLEQQLGRPLSRRALTRIQRAAGGNPFFALELARLLPTEASPAATLPMPDSLRAMVEDRIGELPKESRELLLIAAALGFPTVEGVLSASSGPRPRSLAALDQAADTGVVSVHEGRIEFTHPLFAEGVYSLAPTAERRAVHRRLASLVDDIEERARHLARATPPDGPNDEVAEVLDAAAEHARRRGAPDVAAELAEQARVLTRADDAEARLRRSIRSAQYHFHAGELAPAREILDTVLSDTPSGTGRAHALRLLGEIRYHEESIEEGNRLFEEALRYVGDDVILRAVLQLELAYGLNSLGDFFAAVSHAHDALALAERTGDAPLLAEALAVAAIADALAGLGVDERKVERSLELEDPNRQVPVVLRPSLIAGCLALYEGRLERSAELLLPLRGRVRERGEESDLAFVSGNLAWGACWRGDLELASGYVDEALESARRSQADSWLCLSLAFAAVQAAYAGEAELTHARAEECRALAPRTSLRVAVLWAGWAEGILAHSHDDPQAAEAALGPLVAPFEGQPLPEPARVFFIPDAIEALIGVGRLEPAERLLAAFADSAGRVERGWALMMASRARALLLWARGDPDGASREADEALAACEDLELRIEVARTLLVAGRLERRRRRKRAATNHLRQAGALFEEMGARLWAERAKTELGRVGLRPSAPDELTPSERRVAELTASGLKNREVAARLFLSPKTIEATLARVYRKLGIQSRAELGAWFADSGRPPA
jgi:DNA-binding CsgD family transcriptional regulator